MAMRADLPGISGASSENPLPVAVIVGVLYFGLATAMIRLTSDGRSIATIWPANAVLLGALLLYSPRRWPPLLLAGFAANVLANWLARGNAFGSMLFGLATLVEMGTAAGMLHASVDREGLLRHLPSVWRFLLWAGVIAPAVSALPGGAVAAFLYGQPFLKSALTWYVTDALGLLVFTPFFYSLFSGSYARDFRAKTPRQRAEAAGILALMTVCTLAIFHVSGLPILFLIAIPEMLVAFRLGWLCTKLSVMIVAVIGACYTSFGMGPISLASHDPAFRAVFFQFFLASQLLIMLPVVAALSARDDLLEELRQSERSMRLLAEQSLILLLNFDPAGHCVKVVGTPEKLLGKCAEDLLGQDITTLAPTAREDLERLLERVLKEPDRIRSIDFLSPMAEGTWLEFTLRNALDSEGRCLGLMATLQDVTARQAHQAALVHAAETDEMTGLLNRAAFVARLEAALAAGRGSEICLAILDVDRFKLINDNAGHQLGNSVLRAVAARISAELDTPDIVARLGGDEFVVMLEASSLGEAEAVCGRLIAAVGNQPIALPSGDMLSVKISCGLTRGGRGLTCEQLLHRADAALFAAKRAGRNRIAAVA